MYNIPSEYSDLDPHGQPKVNGLGPTGPGGTNAGPYRTSTAFNAFSNNRMRNQHAPTSSVQYRDNTPQPSSFNQQHYPTAADVFPVHQMTSPSQQQQQAQSYDIHQGQGFEYTSRNGPQGNNTASISTHTKQSQYALDLYTGVSPSALIQNVGNIKGGLSAAPPGIHPQQQGSDGYQVNTWNGMHIQSQTPYGPHLQTPGSAGPPNSAIVLNNMSHLNGANGGPPPGNGQEEISTIFVVGFPEDMQEREFQNMFTFSVGFEAATLKIPNKEYTAYGGPGGTAPPGSGSVPLRAGGNLGFGQYGAGGSNDPYNLVTVNQGGVVVDGGRDGTTASWPSSGMQDSLDANGHFGPGGQAQNALPPRKQIIGFAKFRSRQEALDARDMLQGRRVDIEKGAVLKAEMAKKNLHTKRGVGLMGVGGGMGVGGLLSTGGIGVNGGGSMSSDAIAGLAALNMNGISGGTEVMSARERELGALGAMGLGGLNHWRESRVTMAEGALSREDEERERRRERDSGTLNAMGLGSATRGPRERAEEDEREREKRRKEKEARLRSTNSNAFDAFHSVPPQSISRVTSNSNSLLVPNEQQQSNGVGSNSPLLGNGYTPHSPNMQQDEYGSGLAGPWGKVNMTPSATLPARPPSTSRPSSPPGSSPFSPSANSLSLPSHHSLPIRPRPFSPPNDATQPQATPSSGVVTSVPPSSTSSNAGESQTGSVGEDVMKALSDLAVSTGATGNISPQLPSPGSVGSAGGAKANVIDQNPPINTLYVGNLPTTQAPQGYPTNYLEDSLRELFQRRLGYRKLCFRQKSNGPMCFVEFEDVNYAAKALNELYGNTLNGLIKGGIRLSYSKNPLGVRTPTSAGGNGPTLQQQQQQNNALQQGLASPFPPDAFSSRHSEDGRRRDIATSLPGYNNYMVSPPPPRFFSPPPASSAFNTLGDSTPAFTRVNNGYFSPPIQSSFSPFGISTPPHTHANIPESTGPELEDQHYSSQHRVLSPPANSIEVARAG